MLNSSKINLSIVIVTRNRESILSDCIARLLGEPERPHEIIVVDSSSTNATQALIQYFPSINYHWIGDIPYSMVLSRNVGISLASGDVIAFIDDDCFIQPGWLSELSNVFVNPEIVAAGGRIIYHPWKVPIASNTIAEINFDKDAIWAEWDRIPDGIIDVPTLPGGNCAVRREVALSVGGFDTNFIGSANLEETDFFYRVAQTGGRIVLVPTAVVEHRAASRTDNIVRSDANFMYRYSLVRNRLYFLRKHRASGIHIAVKHQLLHLIAGIWKMLRNLVTFGAASFLGILAGLFTPISANVQGLEQYPHQTMDRDPELNHKETASNPEHGKRIARGQINAQDPRGMR